MIPRLDFESFSIEGFVTGNHRASLKTKFSSEVAFGEGSVSKPNSDPVTKITYLSCCYAASFSPYSGLSSQCTCNYCQYLVLELLCTSIRCYVNQSNL